MKKDTFRRLRACCEIINEKKCTDVKLLDVRETSGITDYIILASCNSEPHLKAVGWAIYEALKQQFGQLCRVDYQPLSGWFALDAFDIMVHAMTSAIREQYRIDQLWQKAEILDSETIFPVDISEKSTACVR